MPEVAEQQLRMDNHAVSGLVVFLKQPAERVALTVGEMLLAQLGIAEGQPGRDFVFPRQRKGCLGIAAFRPDTAATPDTVRRSAIEGADFAPVVKVFPVLAVQWQEGTIQVVKRKQAGEMVIGDALLWGHPVGVFGHGDHPAWKRSLPKQLFIKMVSVLYRVSASGAKKAAFH